MSIAHRKPGFRDFWRIANSVLNKAKPATPPLFNGPEVFLAHRRNEASLSLSICITLVHVHLN